MNITLGASGILTDNKGRILLGRRVETDEAYPGTWCTPGGGVENLETIEHAIEREFYEEVRIFVHATGLFTSVQQRIEGRKHIVLVFKLVRLTQDLCPEPGDGFDAVQFFSRRQIDLMAETDSITPLTYAALQDFWER